MKVDFQINTKGLDELNKSLKKLGNVSIRVGILGGGTKPESGQTLAEIGAIHEFGKITARIPRRSFLKDTLENAKLDELIRFSADALKALTLNKINEKKCASMIGAKAQSLVIQAFQTGGFGQWPALSQFTVDKKKSDKILIDTGQLRRSITFDVKFS